MVWPQPTGAAPGAVMMEQTKAWRMPQLIEVLSDRVPTDPESSWEACLERGDILYFGPGTMPRPSEEEQNFLREHLPDAIRLKNISYHPEGGYISGIQGDGDLRGKTSGILRRHNDEIAAALKGYLPRYAARWRRGKVNFRPLEEQGRKLSRHASNELIHTDAFASGATHGDRVLRYFTNIHPLQSRRWKSAGTFGELFAEYGCAAGLFSAGVEIGMLGKAFSAGLKALAKVGLPQAVLVDTSPYDRFMRRFHNYLKDNEEFQQNGSRQVMMEFPPMSSWAVLTDSVSHGVISGRHALVNTFHIRLQDCVLPELAPYNILAARG